MKTLAYMLIAMLVLSTSAVSNPPVCGSKEYAKYECSTVYINGKRVQECRWVCLPLSSAGR